MQQLSKNSMLAAVGGSNDDLSGQFPINGCKGFHTSSKSTN